MRRKKNSLRKEKIIMISASAFVLTALTMAGVYVREQSKESDEYRVDLSELDGQSVADKTSEIAENQMIHQQDLIVADDLDADPDFWEVNSPGVEAELTDATDEKVTAKEVWETMSLSRRSSIISICKSPKKPQRKPKPSATEVSGSNIKAASLS